MMFDFFRHWSSCFFIWLIGVILVLLTSGGAAYLLYTEHQASYFQRELETLAEKIDLQYTQPRRLLGVLARNQAIIDLAAGKETPDNPVALALLNHVKISAQAALVYVLNAQGTVVGSSLYGNKKTLTGNNYSFRPYFHQAMAGRLMVYPALGVTTKKRGIYLSTPLFSANNQIIGVVVVKIGLAEIDVLLKRVGRRNRGPVALVSSEGVIFSASRQDWLYHLSGTPLDPQSYQALLQSKQFSDAPLTPLPWQLTQDRIGIDKVNYQVLRQSISIPGWEVVIGYGEMDYPALPTAQSKLLWGACLSSFVLLSIIVLLVHNIMRRRRVEATLHDHRESLEKEIAIRTKDLVDNHHYLEKSRERLSVTLRSISDGVLATDNNGLVVLLNPVAEKLTGWKKNDAIGKSVAEVFKIVDEQTGLSCHNPAIEMLESGCASEKGSAIGLCDRVGNRCAISASVAPILNRSNDSEGVVLVFRDISRRVKMAEEVLKVKKLESMGVLAGGIGHDFNNILTALIGNLNLSRRLLEEDERAYPLLREAERAALRAKDLTRQLLSFSKGGELIKKTASIGSLITDSARFVLRGSSVACTFEIPANLWAVEVDGGQMSQVIQNLIINARHAMPKGGTIEVACANIEDIYQEGVLFKPVQKKYVKIEVVDHGVGIPKKIMDHIFDPYFTTKHEGSGLGLAISNGIVSKHEGHIQAESLAGKGTTFIIYLPASSQPHSAISEENQTLVKGSGLLIVMDDDEMLRNLARQGLSHLGYTILTTADGLETVNLYQQLQETGKTVTGVIMDLTIPGGVGAKEAVAMLQAFDSKARVLVASGYSHDPVMLNYAEYGFCGAVAKPFDLHELGATVKAAFFQDAADAV